MSKRCNPVPVDPLWEAYWIQGKSLALRDRIVEHYFPLVSRMVAWTLRLLPRSIDRHVIESAVGQGLIEAVERFEPGKRCSFRTFANRVMRRRIQDALRRIEGDPLRHSSRDVEQLEHLYVEEPLAADLDDVPLQAATGSRAAGTGGTLPLLAVLDGDAYRSLNLAAKAALHLRFSAKFRQREIAQVLRISRPRVSQILREATSALQVEYSMRIDK